MTIKRATQVDPKLIKALVEIDQIHYGKYGASERYFLTRITNPTSSVFVVNEGNDPTGFAVCELVERDGNLTDFVNLSIPLPSVRWLHIIAFTTRTDFKNIKEDSVLLSEIENYALSQSCEYIGVPLSIEHPYPEAYPFFEKNSYKKVGTLDWIAEDSTKILCNFLLKILSKK